MIHFTKLSFKNILSFGNTPTIIFLDRSPSTLIIGQSGHGKSTIIESLCFGLFGKPFRKITKKNLVNTVNNKDCLVEVEFKIEDLEYKVVRGIKPDVFEIYVNGELLNQDPTTRDYQDYLEKNILKMSYKTFTQIVVLGFANYTPFMMLSAGERRAMVDELLDTNIFSRMMEVLKVRLSTTKTEIGVLSSNIEAYETSLEVLRSNLTKLRESDNKQRESIEAEIEELNGHIEELSKIIEEKQSIVESLQDQIEDITTKESSVTTYRDLLTKIEHNKETVESGISFFEENDQCPTCNQSITEEYKTTALESRRNKVKEFTGAIDKLQGNISKILSEITASKETLKTVGKLEKEILIASSNVSNYQRSIQSKIKQLADHKPTDAVDDTKDQIKKLEDSVSECKDRKISLTEDRHYYEVAQTLLKDDGIKSLIIKEYVPIINQLVNMYLDSMQFTMRFVLDETFEEQILSRFRDELKFQSLSQGEQSRLSLAIMLAWRKLAELRNSVATNILFLDETLDAAINAADLESVVNLLGEVSKENNVFIISHKPDALYDKVHSVIEIEKHGNFSRIKK